MRSTALLIGAVGASAALMTAPGITAAQDTTRTREEATGEISRVRIDNLGLAQSQVERLQQRLNDMGCDAGVVDGLIGPRTRQAITCARTRENVPGNDIQELIRELGIDAAPLDSADFPRPAMPRDTLQLRTPSRDTMMRDTGLMRPPRDTLTRDTLQMRLPQRDPLVGDSLRLQRDTIRRDTLPRVPRDTLRRDTTRSPRDTLRDTIPPTPPIPPDTTRRPPPR